VVSYIASTDEWPLRVDPRPLLADTSPVYRWQSFAAVEESAVAVRADALRRLGIPVGDITADAKCTGKFGGIPYMPPDGQAPPPDTTCREEWYRAPFVATILSLPRSGPDDRSGESVVVRVNLARGLAHRVVDVLARRSTTGRSGWQVVGETEIFHIQS
jgi:hypothetical protein